MQVQAAFSARIRDEVGLETVSDDLLTVVAETAGYGVRQTIIVPPALVENSVRPSGANATLVIGP